MDGYTATRIIREFEKNFALKAGSSIAEGQQQTQQTHQQNLTSSGVY